MTKKYLMRLTAILCCAMTAAMFTACTDIIDNPVVDPVKPDVKKYVERLVPVIDPKGEAQGTVTLRFYEDMPNVAYVSISNFQGIMYPGTTVQVTKTADNQDDVMKVSLDRKSVV